MKFLVLSLCVCAASAASFFGNNQYSRGPQPQQAVVQTFAKAAAAVPDVFLNPAYNAANVVANAPVIAAKPVVTAPVVAAKAVYANAKTGYNAGSDAEAVILRSDNEVSADGFAYTYETGNGISSQASGQLKKVDNTDVLVQKGGFRYIAPDGTPVEVNYIADENGYHAEGAVIPVAPPVPEAILRALAYIAAHPPKSENY